MGGVVSPSSTSPWAACLLHTSIGSVAEVKKGHAVALLLLSSTIAALSFIDLCEPTSESSEVSLVVFLGLAGYLLFKGAQDTKFPWRQGGSLPLRPHGQKQDSKDVAPGCPKSPTANWHTKKGQGAQAVALLEQTSTNASKYNKLIACAVKKDDMITAEARLQQMSTNGVKANEVSSATVIQGWAKRGDPSRAQELLGTMAEVDLEPTAVCFNAIISACIRAGDTSAATADAMSSAQACRS